MWVEHYNVTLCTFRGTVCLPMPESANEHLDFLRERVRTIDPASVLDVGMGRGNYGWFLRQDVGWRGTLVGLEVWAPYVDGPNALAGGNRTYYNRIEIGDVRKSEQLVESLAPDVVFAFDVIEHMVREEGVAVLAMLARHCRRELLVSVPIVPYPQGPIHGNPYEEHHHDWTVSEMEGVGGSLLSRGAATGLFGFPAGAR